MNHTRIIALQTLNRAVVDVLYEARLRVELRVCALVGAVEVPGGESDLCRVGGAGEGVDHDVGIGIGIAIWWAVGGGVTSWAHGGSEETRKWGSGVRGYAKMIHCEGVSTSGMTRCAAEAERKDEIPVGTEMIRVALQLTSKRNMTIEMNASTRQQFKLAEMGMSKRHGRQLHLCLNR